MHTDAGAGAAGDARIRLRERLTACQQAVVGGRAEGVAAVEEASLGAGALHLAEHKRRPYLLHAPTTTFVAARLLKHEFCQINPDDANLPLLWI